MNWKEKIEKLKNLQNEREELALYFMPADPSPPEFVNKIKFEYPFIPDSYIDFLRYSDGIQLHWFILFGSGESSFEPIEKSIKSWAHYLDLKEYYPIGKDSSGDTFLLKKDEVYLISTDPPYSMEYITRSFDELLSNYFLGASYPKLFSNKTYEKNDWYRMLKDLKWA